MTHKTNGIVLKTVRYGETSLIVSIFTEKFGLQSYLVNGVRTQTKAAYKAAFYQPASILQMVVYHNNSKNLQRIKECNWQVLYRSIFDSVPKNSVALFMVELVGQLLKQPEANEALYGFCEDALLKLDEATDAVVGNFPLYFSMHLPYFFGFRINDLAQLAAPYYLDLKEGFFTSLLPQHPHYLDTEEAALAAEILRVMQPKELDQIKIAKPQRTLLLQKMLLYYQLHVPDMGIMRTPDVLQQVFSND